MPTFKGLKLKLTTENKFWTFAKALLYSVALQCFRLWLQQQCNSFFRAAEFKFPLFNKWIKIILLQTIIVIRTRIYSQRFKWSSDKFTMKLFAGQILFFPVSGSGFYCWCHCSFHPRFSFRFGANKTRKIRGNKWFYLKFQLLFHVHATKIRKEKKCSLLILYFTRYKKNWWI